MFNSLFAKYARAASDEEERKKLYRLYCGRMISAIVFFALCFAFIAEALLFAEKIESGEIGIEFILFGLTMLLVPTSGITALVLWIKFRSYYRSILEGAPKAGEMPETVSYRKKTVENKKNTKKAMLPATIILIVGIVAMIVLIAIDSIRNPDSEEFGLLGYIGAVAFGISFFIFLMRLSYLQNKKQLSGQSVEMQTADETRKIDEAQGRKHKYSLREDKNLQSYRYLFPNEALCAEAEAARKKMQKASGIASLISCLVAFALVVIFFSPYVLKWESYGYGVPIFLTLIFGASAIASYPFVRKLNVLEKKQKAELESNPNYAKNLEIYSKYEAFSKRKGKTLAVSVVAAIVCGYVLAILIPNSAWSTLSIILIIIGLFLNQRFVAALRKDVIPLEKEIDREEKGKSDRELAKSIVEFHSLWNRDIKDIWESQDRNEFVVAMVGWLNQKCDYGNRISVLMPEERIVFVADSFCQEVNNGGFEQFLDNCGAFVSEAPAALTAIGAARTVEIYEKAFAVLPPSLPADEDERNKALFGVITDDISEMFMACDMLFYKEVGDFEEELYRYILAHKECFMVTDSVKDLQFALKAVCEIYGLDVKDIQIIGGEDSFSLTFFFMQRKITVDKRKDRTGDIYLEIYVTEKPEGPLWCEPTLFDYLYAYYDDKRCVAHYNNANLHTYLQYLRRYIEEDKIFYIECDIQNERRYFYIDGVKKELPYGINLDTENVLRFGDKAEQIERNRPID